MSDKMRWRYGDTNPVTAAVDADTIIEIGDMLLQERGVAGPAVEATDAKEFKAHFLGVAMNRSRKGDATPIRVATTGVFEFDADADTYVLGDMVCPAVESNTICNQKCRKTDLRYLAIGRVEKNVGGPSAGSVLVRIFSQVMGPV